MYNKENLIRSIVVQSPFSRAELTEDIFEEAISSSLDVFNSFNPLIKVIPAGLFRQIENDDDSGQSEIMEVIGDKFSDQYNDVDLKYMNDIDNSMVPSSTYVKAKVSWSLEEMYNKSNKRKFVPYFEEIVIGHCMMFMANNRRSAEMSGLPFEIKGDAFYQEGFDRADVATKNVINMAPNFLEP